MGAQVGHIPRKLMEKLAPYIDSGDVHVEGVITGEKAVRKLSLLNLPSLSIYPTGSPFSLPTKSSRLLIFFFPKLIYVHQTVSYQPSQLPAG